MNIYLDLFLTFFKIGLFTIGGGYAMIPLIQQEVVNTHGWMTLETLTDFMAVAESTPGPFAINTATFIGNQTAGIAGAALATFGVVLPSLIIIMLIAALFSKFKENKWVQAALYGMSAVVVGLVASALFTLSKTVFWTGSTVDFRALIIFACCVFLYFKWKMKPIPIILISAAAGLVAYGLLG